MFLQINHEPDYNVLLAVTVIFASLCTVVIPSFILLFYHKRLQRAQRSAGEGVEPELVDRFMPFITKERALYAWARIAISFVAGLTLLTIYASRVENLDISFDYAGPMLVKDFKIHTMQSWRSSGLSRSWVVQGFVTLEIEWPTSGDKTEGSDDTVCHVQHVYSPCVSPGYVCSRRPCLEQETLLEQELANDCLAEALEAYNSNSISESYAYLSSTTTMDDDSSPTLPFFGNRDTCEIRSTPEVEDVQVSNGILSYLGWASVILGVVLTVMQPLLFLNEYWLHEEMMLDDGSTECCSVASDFDADGGDEESGGLGKLSSAEETQGTLVDDLSEEISEDLSNSS